jgi:hypothetical protein
VRLHERRRGGARSGLFALTVLAAAVSGIATVSPPAGGTAHSRTHAKTQYLWMYATYYGWYTNTPPGCATAYSGCAHGRGTYSDPITFATDRKEFPVGTLLYYPTDEKYFVMGDACTECTADWKGKGPDGGPRLRHVDLWIGGKGASAFAAINCEDAMTQTTPSGAPFVTPFIVQPPPTLPVSTEPLFDARTGHCFGGATTTATHGHYENAAGGNCLAIGRGVAATLAATLQPCSDASREDLAFEGAFFVVQHRCLQTEGARAGARIVFAPCKGGPGQQWETGPSGTIEWVQYARCIVDSGGRLVLGSCATGAAATWRYARERGPRHGRSAATS